MKLQFTRGLQQDLDKVPLHPGTFYFTVDTSRVFFDTTIGRKRICLHRRYKGE